MDPVIKSGIPLSLGWLLCLANTHFLLRRKRHDLLCLEGGVMYGALYNMGGTAVLLQRMTSLLHVSHVFSGSKDMLRIDRSNFMESF